MYKQKQAEPLDNVRYQQQQVGKEFDRKRLILKYQKTVLIIGIALVIILVGLGITYAWIKANKKTNTEQTNSTQEMPPAGFNIQVKQVDILPDTQNKYDATLKIVNTDQNWGVPILSYSILLKDANKNTIGERQGTTFILPNQEKSIIELAIDSNGKAAVASASLKIDEVQKLTESPNLNFATENLSFQNLDSKSKVSGTIINQTPFGFDEITINVLLYDQNSKLVGVNFTTVNDLTPNQKRDFTVFWRKEISVKNPKIVIEASVNPFNSTPFLDIYSQGQMLQY